MTLMSDAWGKVEGKRVIERGSVELRGEGIKIIPTRSVASKRN